MDVGPQDHGWCAGYTCQRRLSLFHSIVALGKSYEVYFTGTSPQNLRLMLLNVDHDKVRQDRNNFLFSSKEITFASHLSHLSTLLLVKGCSHFKPILKKKKKDTLLM